MSDTPRRPSLFDRLKAGLEDGVEHARGGRPLKTTAAPPAAADIRRLRGKLRATRTAFAGLLGVTPAALDRLEDGTTRPRGPVLRLIAIYTGQPGLAEVGLAGRSVGRAVRVVVLPPASGEPARRKPSQRGPVRG